MWTKFRKFVLTYTALVYLSNLILYFIAEKRPDAYVSLSILTFYITYTIYRPLKRASLRIKLLHVVLLTLFLVIVAYRVYQVIAK